MPKKSTQKSKQVANGSVVEEAKKTSTTPKKSGNEIDEIFAGKKRQKADKEKAKKPAGDAEALNLGVKMMKKNKKQKKDIKKSGADKETGNDFTDPLSQSRKRTGDGLVVYTEEELGIGKADAGGTPLCPFDCDCCF